MKNIECKSHRGARRRNAFQTESDAVSRAYVKAMIR